MDDNTKTVFLAFIAFLGSVFGPAILYMLNRVRQQNDAKVIADQKVVTAAEVTAGHVTEVKNALNVSNAKRDATAVSVEEIKQAQVENTNKIADIHDVTNHAFEILLKHTVNDKQKNLDQLIEFKATADRIKVAQQELSDAQNDFDNHVLGQARVDNRKQ
jgi:hypothetical protein